MPPVLQNVNQRVANFAWRLESAGVVALGEYGSLSLEREIEAFRESNRKALHSPGEMLLVLGLAQEVDVVVLDAVVAEAISVARGPRANRVKHDSTWALAS
jgi:hypothetical protein